jgi:hypothetical protein
LLCIRGLANGFSCSEVWPPKQDDLFVRFHFSVVFFGTKSCAASSNT